jgi:hypothetical protein
LSEQALPAGKNIPGKPEPLVLSWVLMVLTGCVAIRSRLRTTVVSR